MKQKKIPSCCVGIVGLGLIGGSIGLDLQKQGWHVRGFTNRAVTAKEAEERGLAQVVSTDLGILSGCEVVILALPLDKLLKPEKSLVKALPSDAIITDVGSVKEPVLNIWRDLHPNFVGSHPMAGTSQRGVTAGQQGLFENRPWISTPEKKTKAEALEVVHQLATALGSKWLTTDAKNHDQAVALISHLPVLVSAALLRTLGDVDDPTIRDLAINLVSSGFEDTTRVGGGNPELGTAMAENNTNAILKGLISYQENLEKLVEIISKENWSELKCELERIKVLRTNFVRSSNMVNFEASNSDLV